MSKLAIAFLRGIGPTSRAIRLFQGNRITHVALLDMQTMTMWESQAPRGVFNTYYPDWVKKYGEPVIFDWPGDIAPIDRLDVLAFLDANLGKKYGWLEAIYLFIRPIVRLHLFDDPNTWICTEFIETALGVIGMRLMPNIWPQRIRPGDLYNQCVARCQRITI